MSCCRSYHPHIGGDFNSHYSNSGHSVKENGKIFRLSTSNVEFCKIKIDGGVFPTGSAPKKCDWVFILCGDQAKLYFIELKGNGISIEGDPYDQITQTINHFRGNMPSLSKQQIFGVVVGAKMPGRNSPTWRKKQDQFRKQFGNKLDRKDPIYELPI